MHTIVCIALAAIPAAMLATLLAGAAYGICYTIRGINIARRHGA